jgi:hypothetical protein
MPDSVAYVDSCNIERLNGAPPPAGALALKAGDPLSVTGWVVDDTIHRSPERVFVVVQSVATGERWSIPISGRTARDDVAKARNSDANSGFQAQMETSSLPAGEYLVFLVSWQDGPAQLCDVGRRVAIE